MGDPRREELELVVRISDDEEVQLVDVWHVYPVGDQIDHEMSCYCICGPRLEKIEAEENDGCAVLATHHSLDGREANEEREGQEQE